MPVTHGWDEQVHITTQSAFTTPAVATAASAVRVESLECGDIEARELRFAKDKTIGRDESNVAFIYGLSKPIAWTLKGTVYPSGTAGTAPQGINNLFTASGMTETINGGTSAVYTPTANPGLLGCTITRGDKAATLAEVLYGAFAQKIQMTFGGQESAYEISGLACGKDVCGQSTVADVANGTVTTITLQTVAHAYRFIAASGALYAQIESECIKITAVNYTNGELTVVRAQAGTSGAAHAAGSTIKPYIPTATYLAGVPISEATGSLSLDAGSTTYNVIRGSWTLTTGMDLGPAEYGTTKISRAVSKRFSVESEFEAIIDVAQQDLMGRVNQMTAASALYTVGTTAGNKWKVAMTKSAIKPFATPFPKDQIVMAKIPLAHRGDSGNDTYTLTFF